MSKGITNELQLNAVVDDLFEMLDADDDGFVSMDEFVNKYVDSRHALDERKKETGYRIVDHYRQEQEVRFKYKQCQDEVLTEQGIRSDSKLKVHIVDAVNLAVGQPYRVRVEQDTENEVTNNRPGPGPIWNEAILFNIVDNSKPIILEVEQVGLLNNVTQIRTEISLREQSVREYSK